jgi:hypothetical protein
MATQRSSTEEIKPGGRVVEKDPSNIEAPKPPADGNGLFLSQAAVLTPEELHAEKKFRLKIDLIILPLIATVYFLAALASLPTPSPLLPDE